MKTKINSISTIFQDVKLFEISSFNDDRGSFKEVFNEVINDFIDINFIQDNESYSKFGVLRGLHFQKSPHQQSKLIRVSLGKIQDVIVDIRKNSNTFGKWESYELSQENNLMLFIPKGFAHGFLVLSEEAIVNYKTDNYYNSESESGIIYNDSKLNINWNLNSNQITISNKDLGLPEHECH